MQLPANLRSSIEKLLAQHERRSLAAAALDVSLKYRREKDITDLQIKSLTEAKAYIATRLPATWCAITDVLQKFLEVCPEFVPETVLDIGAGPGTATLAVQNIWPDISATLLEPNIYLREAGSELNSASDWQNQRLQDFSTEKTYDLVLASYVFNEIAEDLSPSLDKAWKATKDSLILIEPGTPHGYSTILKARNYFLSLGANIAAPCPHEHECPLRNSDRWCHFSVRVDRSRLHIQTKADAKLSYEDEKFSYLILTKSQITRPRFRALGMPHGQKVITLESCQSDGTSEIVQVSKRDEDYKMIKKMDWGEAAF